MRIAEPDSPDLPAPLWRLAFRAGFLLAAAFAVAAAARWLLWLERPSDWGLAPHWWHGHEMIFGFAMPVVAGFLLTAVATWTGTRGTAGLRLQALFGLWLAARALLWWAPGLAPLAALAETAFLLFTAWELGQRVWPARQWRNLLFLPVLLGLMLLCLASYAAMDSPPQASRLHYGALWLLGLLVTIVGGRVTPLFTANRLGRPIAPLPRWYETAVIVFTAAVAAGAAAGLATAWACALYLLTAALHLGRLWRWQGWLTLRVPLLWSMHLNYLCLPLAMIGLALAGDDPVARKHAVHLLGIGSVGGMILAMMSRVSLGHTGRPLEVPPYIAGAFAAVLLAAVLRAGLPALAPELSLWAWRLSAGLWIAAFALFLLRYAPVLCRQRVDGGPG